MSLYAMLGRYLSYPFAEKLVNFDRLEVRPSAMRRHVLLLSLIIGALAIVPVSVVDYCSARV
jgi:hypothetical protein